MQKLCQSILFDSTAFYDILSENAQTHHGRLQLVSSPTDDGDERAKKQSSNIDTPKNNKDLCAIIRSAKPKKETECCSAPTDGDSLRPSRNRHVFFVHSHRNRKKFIIEMSVWSFLSVAVASAASHRHNLPHVEIYRLAVPGTGVKCQSNVVSNCSNRSINSISRTPRFERDQTRCKACKETIRGAHRRSNYK